MIKQLTRGYVYFEEKKIEDVRHVFGNFRFDEARFKFFEKIKINNEDILSPGVFLNGQINEKYTSENVVRLFRKLMGLDIEKKNCDISIEREDELEELGQEREFNFYYSLKFLKTEAKENLEKFSKAIRDGVFFRTRDVGYQEGYQLTTLEIFSTNNIEEKINDLVVEKRINVEEKVEIKF